MFEPEFRRPDADETPEGEDEDPECYEEEHGFCLDLVVFLDEPECAKNRPTAFVKENLGDILREA